MFVDFFFAVVIFTVSNLGKNVKALCALYDTNPLLSAKSINDIKSNCNVFCRNKWYEALDDMIISISEVCSELIDVRDGQQFLQIHTDDELIELLKALCCN